MSIHESFDWSKPFVAQAGVEYVRGCEVEGMLDEKGRVIEEGEECDVWVVRWEVEGDYVKVIGEGEECDVWVVRWEVEGNYVKVIEGRWGV